MIFGFRISLVGILCTSPGVSHSVIFIAIKHTTITLPLHISRPNSRFSLEKTAHESQMKMTGLVIRETAYVFISTTMIMIYAGVVKNIRPQNYEL